MRPFSDILLCDRYLVLEDIRAVQPRLARWGRYSRVLGYIVWGLSGKFVSLRRVKW